MCKTSSVVNSALVFACLSTAVCVPASAQTSLPTRDLDQFINPSSQLDTSRSLTAGQSVTGSAPQDQSGGNAGTVNLASFPNTAAPAETCTFTFASGAVVAFSSSSTICSISGGELHWNDPSFGTAYTSGGFYSDPTTVLTYDLPAISSSDTLESVVLGSANGSLLKYSAPSSAATSTGGTTGSTSGASTGQSGSTGGSSTNDVPCSDQAAWGATHFGGPSPCDYHAGAVRAATSVFPILVPVLGLGLVALAIFAGWRVARKHLDSATDHKPLTSSLLLNDSARSDPCVFRDAAFADSTQHLNGDWHDYEYDMDQSWKRKYDRASKRLS